MAPQGKLAVAGPPPAPAPAAGLQSPAPAGQGEALDSAQEKALRARFEALKEHLAAERIEAARRIIDAELLDRALSARPRLKGLGPKAAFEILRESLSEATFLRVQWEDRPLGIAVLETAAAGGSQGDRLRWVLREGEWYFLPRLSARG